MTLTVAVIGSIMLDVTVQTPRLPASGENIHVPSITLTAGGKGANAAVTLARHGVDVLLVGNVGDDFWGQHLLGALRAEDLPTDLIAQHATASTGTVVMLTEPGGATSYLAHTGASFTLTAADVRARLTPHLPTLDALYFNFEAPAPALQAAVDLVTSRNIPLFIDAGPARPYPASLWSRATLLSPNASEAEALIDVSVTDRDSALHAATQLQSRGPANVVIKRGNDGAVWANAGDRATVPAFAVEAVDTAGAGDAFTAGLTWALLNGDDLPAAVRWASACGALVACRVGTLPTMPTRAEVAAFLATNPQ
jgi:ribokinase